MDDRARRRVLRPLLVAVLALQLLALVVAAAFAFSGDGKGGALTLAQGSPGGMLHPVAGNFEPDGTELEGCGADYLCLSQAFGNIAYARGPQVALALFDERMAADPYVEANCHGIAHTVGSAAFARFEGDVALTFSKGSPSCASGYYHGLLERAFVGVDRKQGLVKVARSICVAGGMRPRGFLDFQCRHGLGHGLMIQTGYDLPLSLQVCSQLGTRWDEVLCSGGAFMENLSTRFGFKSRWLDDEDPLNPCNRVGVRFSRSCYLRVATRIITLNRIDWAATARTCAGVAPAWSPSCFRGYGRETAVQTRYAVDRILRLCDVAGSGRGDCLYGAARTIADNFQSATRAAPLCLSAPRADREACYAGIGVVVGLLEPTNRTRRAACAGLSRAHTDACTAAAIAEVDPSGRETWG